jgi:ubiquinone/menaquinone biosynthesis C-methylase UbiE
LDDLFCPCDLRGDFSFYLLAVMPAKSVLDVGCGIGMLLHRARDAGHKGCLLGLEPADATLKRYFVWSTEGSE